MMQSLTQGWTRRDSTHVVDYGEGVGALHMLDVNGLVQKEKKSWVTV